MVGGQVSYRPLRCNSLGVQMYRMDDTQNAPSVSQAKRIKELAQKGQFTSDAVVAIMGEEKKGELDTVTIKNDILRKYFPRSYTPRQMEEKIIQLLDAWQKKRQRSNER